MRESESTAGQYSLSVRHEGKKYHYRIQVFCVLYLLTCIVLITCIVFVGGGGQWRNGEFDK